MASPTCGTVANTLDRLSALPAELLQEIYDCLLSIPNKPISGDDLGHPSRYFHFTALAPLRLASKLFYSEIQTSRLPQLRLVLRNNWVHFPQVLGMTQHLQSAPTTALQYLTFVSITNQSYLDIPENRYRPHPNVSFAALPSLRHLVFRLADRTMLRHRMLPFEADDTALQRKFVLPDGTIMMGKRVIQDKPSFPRS